MAGVSAFPMRVKCATLAWHTMKSALEGGVAAKTE
jgi:nitrogen fixation NifU-like protein